jgi:YD repeat-containing protein
VSDGTYHATYSYLANSPLISQITFRSNSVMRMTTTKRYDYLNRLLAISNAPSAATSLANAYMYNDGNQRTRCTMPDGSFWLYEYDPLGQLVSAKRFWADGTPVAGQQFEYGYDDTCPMRASANISVGGTDCPQSRLDLADEERLSHGVNNRTSTKPAATPGAQLCEPQHTRQTR